MSMNAADLVEEVMRALPSSSMPMRTRRTVQQTLAWMLPKFDTAIAEVKLPCANCQCQNTEVAWSFGSVMRVVVTCKCPPCRHVTVLVEESSTVAPPALVEAGAVPG